MNFKKNNYSLDVCTVGLKHFSQTKCLASIAENINCFTHLSLIQLSVAKSNWCKTDGILMTLEASILTIVFNVSWSKDCKMCLLSFLQGV